MYNFIGSKELAKLLNVSVKTIRNHKRDIIGAVKIGRHWKFDLNKIKVAIDNKQNIFQIEEGEK